MTDNPMAAVLDCLNSAYAADTAALHSLLINVVPANQALVDHPHVVVAQHPAGFATVGVLGVINGVLTAAGLQRVAAKYTDTPDAEGRHRMIGFVEYVLPPAAKEAP